MAESEKERFPKCRKFEVHHAFRRYSRLVYGCGAIYTVLEDPHGLMVKYPKTEVFEVQLLLTGAGIYQRTDRLSEHFAFHELDALVKDKVLHELAA